MLRPYNRVCVNASGTINTIKINYSRCGGLLKAMGHPIRLKILEGLLQDECNVKRIVEKLGVAQSTVSQHLGILRHTGIIKARKEGVKTCYKVIDDRVRKIIEILKD